MKRRSVLREGGPIGWLRWWWYRRPIRVSVWELGNEYRWASLREHLLRERGLSEEAANDVRVP